MTTAPISDTRGARTVAADLADRLGAPNARCPKAWALELIAYVVRLADALDAARAALAEARDYQARYGGLVEEYNGVLAALRDQGGIEVFQPGGSAAWHWRCGRRRGQAATIPAAYAAALAVAVDPRKVETSRI